MRIPRRLIVLCLSLAVAPGLFMPTVAWGLLELKFVTAPALPSLPSVTLNASAQTAKTTMTNFSVEDLRLTEPVGTSPSKGSPAPARAPCSPNTARKPNAEAKTKATSPVDARSRPTR